MGKGNSGLDHKFQLKKEYTSQGIIGDSNGYEILREVSLRIKSADVLPSHRITVQGRMEVDDAWEDIGSCEGNVSCVLSISSWDRIRFKCTKYKSNSSEVSITSSAFFEDNSVVNESINNMKDELNLKLEAIDDSLCKLNEQLEILNNQMELITDHNKEEVK